MGATEEATGAARRETPDREALRLLLMERAFVEAGDGRVLRNRAGDPVRWTYYGGDVLLTQTGARLMALAVLDRLSAYRGTQLATFGLSAIPLVAACIGLDGRYSGLVVRPAAKEHGAGRRIDGPIDRDRPVVVVDESISSGRSIHEAVCALEAEGLEVEGAIAVVEFSGYGAVPWLRARGYRVETVFDVWRDLERSGSPPARRPEDEPVRWSDAVAPDGLSPAALARHVAVEWGRTGRLPRPPSRLDGPHDARGGTYVSIRRRTDDVRLARGGFRRDEPQRGEAARDVVLATRDALSGAAAGGRLDLEAVKFAVSLLGPASPATPADADVDTLGLGVRGIGPLDRVGFALPHAPHYDDEIGQYEYARTVTGNFWRLEPHALFVQPVTRDVEDGERWPPYGAAPPVAAPAREPGAIAAVVAQELRWPAADGERREAADVGLGDERVFGVGASLYRDGLVGCAMSYLPDPVAALREALRAALRDTRYRPSAAAGAPDGLVAVVSVLRRERRLGRVSSDRLPLFFRLGRDTLRATSGGRDGLVLAHFAAQQSLDARRYEAQVLAKAGISDGTQQWTAYETEAWAIGRGRSRRIDRGFRSHARFDAADRSACARLAEEIARFVLSRPAPDGLPAYALDPWSAAASYGGTSTRILLAATGLLAVDRFVAAELEAPAARIVERFVQRGRPGPPRPNLTWDSAADAQLLTCLSLLSDRDRHRQAAETVASRLIPLVRADGSIHAGPGRTASDLDFLSGSVLLALSLAAPWLGSPLSRGALRASLAFYRRRFALCSPWGMVWWHGQAWANLAAEVDGAAEFAFELVDWALDRQHAGTGAFVIGELEPRRYSFLTACVLEGVAAAWGLAARGGEAERAARYRGAWERGIAFVERLVLRDADAFFSTAPDRCAGGVRPTLNSAALRVDYAGHALVALGNGLRVTA